METGHRRRVSFSVEAINRDLERAEEVVTQKEQAWLSPQEANSNRALFDVGLIVNKYLYQANVVLSLESLPFNFGVDLNHTYTQKLTVFEINWSQDPQALLLTLRIQPTGHNNVDFLEAFELNHGETQFQIYVRAKVLRPTDGTPILKPSLQIIERPRTSDGEDSNWGGFG